MRYSILMILFLLFAKFLNAGYVVSNWPSSGTITVEVLRAAESALKEVVEEELSTAEVYLINSEKMGSKIKCTFILALDIKTELIIDVEVEVEKGRDRGVILKMVEAPSGKLDQIRKFRSIISNQPPKLLNSRITLLLKAHMNLDVHALRTELDELDFRAIFGDVSVAVAEEKRSSMPKLKDFGFFVDSSDGSRWKVFYLVSLNDQVTVLESAEFRKPSAELVRWIGALNAEAAEVKNIILAVWYAEKFRPEVLKVLDAKAKE